MYKNLFAVDSYSQLFFCDGERNIKAINLKRLTSQEGQDTEPPYQVCSPFIYIKASLTIRPPYAQTIRCKPPITFEIRELIFNERSNLLCAVGAHACAAIEISERVRRELLVDKKRPEEVECRYFQT